MLRSLNSLIGASIHATDGQLGHIGDFLFDDRGWRIRYLVVKTGTWLSSRPVLVSSSAAEQPDWDQRVVPVNLTTDQVRNSPDVDTENPVSRQQEIAMSAHYGWAPYWALEAPLTTMAVPPPVVVSEGDPHLRSLVEVNAYEVRTSDGNLGSVDDAVMDDANWFIRYLIVRTGNWFKGQTLLLPTKSVESISWEDRCVQLSYSMEEL